MSYESYAKYYSSTANESGDFVFAKNYHEDSRLVLLFMLQSILLFDWIALVKVITLFN